MLIGELKDIEDLQIRNTDSLLEYPTLGETLRGLSSRALSTRLKRESTLDNRAAAKLFYKLYGAEGRIGFWTSSETLSDLEEVISHARPRYDELLKTHAILLRLNRISTESRRYREFAYTVFMTAPALLRNYGFKLPIRIDQIGISRYISKKLLNGPFIEARSDVGSNDGQICTVSGTEGIKDGESEYRLTLACPNIRGREATISANSVETAVNKLADAAFTGG
jgi:hypothetical protein